MALSATSLYHLRVDQLSVECDERGLISTGSVQLLRRCLREILRSTEMGGDELRDQDQAGAPVDIGGLDVSMHNSPAGSSSQAMGGVNYTPGLVELVKQVSPVI